MRENRVLNAQQVLGRSLPTLVAFKSVFCMERRHNVPNLHHAPEDVQSVVRRRQQFDVFHHRAGSTCAKLQQVGLVSVAKLRPPQVGAAVTNGHVPQHA